MANTNNNNIHLELTFEEVNMVLQALGNLPFKQVFELIGKIHDQANDQAGGQTFEEE